MGMAINTNGERGTAPGNRMKLCEKCASPLNYRMEAHEGVGLYGGSLMRLWFCPLCHPELETAEL